MKKNILPLSFLAIVALALWVFGGSAPKNLAQILTPVVQQRVSTARVISGPFKVVTPKSVTIFLGIEVSKGGGLSHKFILEKGSWEVVYDPKLNTVTVFNGLNKQKLTTFTPAGNQVSVELVEKLPSGERSAIIKDMEFKIPAPRSTRINP